MKPEPNRSSGHQNFYFGIVIIFIFCVCWLGHHAVFMDYDLSRDEQLANFDADIFSKLRLFAPIPLEWRQMADALNQTYILPIGNHEDWVSFYLPINAGFRAIFGTFFSRSFTSPLLVALGAVALWRVAGQLFPAASLARWVALTLYVGSSQVIITGMTAYAMTGHLALNLLWLTLFLNRKSTSDGMAILVGFLATGLHQPIFHPLFVLPFLNLLRQENAWRRLFFYSVGYILICAFWLFWPTWVSSLGAEPVPLSANPNGVGVMGRLSNMMIEPSARSLWTMSLNLLRFVVWQNVILLPLLIFGIISNWKSEPIARALTIGVILTILAMFILMPYQGHGWGYRYLHGFIGSLCLLATYGFRSLQSRGFSFLRPMLVGTAVSLFILLPVHAILARQMVLPFETANIMIKSEKSAVVIVDDEAVPFGQDLVVNRPNLSNDPIRLKASELNSQEIAELCNSNAKLAFFGAPQFSSIFLPFIGVAPHASKGYLALLRQAQLSGCIGT
jgi:hypothetical protein